MPRDVSVVIVNYNSGDYLARCLHSLGPAAQGGLEAEVVVVENASPLDQSRALAEAERAGARVLRLERNTGYAGGLNRGLAVTSASTVFLINPDVLAREGALPILTRYLAEHPEVALAEPRCFVDAGCAFQQPEFRPVTPFELARAALARTVPSYGAGHARRELRRQLAGWRARSATERRGLSGAFLAARREALARVGGFDEQYPLAYEDCDVFRRLRTAGWKLAFVPEAEAIHFGHRSRITVPAESVAKDRLGRRRYLRKHHGAAAVWLDRGTEWLEARAGRWRARSAPRDLVDLGVRSDPPELELRGASGPFVLQLALEPAFGLAVGHVGEGSVYRFTEPTWSSLLPLPLFARAFTLEGLEPRGAWRVCRAAP
jgi:GT2 family glycosyltransferase